MAIFLKSQTRRNFFQTIAGLTVTSLTSNQWLNAAVTGAQPYTPPKDLLVLENEGTRAEFDPRNGALISLLGKKTGWQLERNSEWAKSFSLLVPLPDRRNNQVAGLEQAAPLVEKSTDGKKITFHWDRVTSQHGGPHEIGFTGTVELTDDGLIFGGEVDNRSTLVVESLNWPCLGDVIAPKDDVVDLLGRTYGSMSRDALLPEMNNAKGYWGTDNSTFLRSGSERFALIATAKEGFYCGIHDIEGREFVSFLWQQIIGHGPASPMEPVVPPDPIEDRHLEFDVARLPYIGPGQKRELVPFVLAHYVGSWHKGADLFNAWAKSWYRPAKSPAWIKDIHSWQQIQVNSPEQEFRFPYSELPTYAADCARHGVKAIQFVGWNHGGQDGGNPFHDAEPQLGGLDALKAAIAKSQQLGVKIMLFSKYTWLDRTLPWFKQEGIKHAIQDPYGYPWIHSGYQYNTLSQWTDVSTHRFSPACFNSAAYRDLACHEFKKVIDTGADGMLYDEVQHHGGANLCFDPTHGHAVPIYVYSGDAKLASAFRQITEEKNPEFAFAGEEGSDYVANGYSLFYTRINPDHVPLARYQYQDIEMMAAVGAFKDGFDDRVPINQCVMYRYIMSYEPSNFKGRLDQIPKTMAYGKLVDDFRRQYRAWLWDDVDVLDTQGAKVDADGPSTRYSVIRQRKTGRRALVMAHQGAANSRPIKITARFDSPPSGSLQAATPEHPEAVSTNGILILPPRSVVVVMET
jgi:hypothetical protein